MDKHAPLPNLGCPQIVYQIINKTADGQLFASCLKDTFATRTKRAKSHHKLKGRLTALNKDQPRQLEFICTKNSAENVQSNRNLLNYQKCVASKYAEKLNPRAEKQCWTEHVFIEMRIQQQRTDFHFRNQCFQVFGCTNRLSC